MLLCVFLVIRHLCFISYRCNEFVQEAIKEYKFEFESVDPIIYEPSITYCFTNTTAKSGIERYDMPRNL